MSPQGREQREGYGLSQTPEAEGSNVVGVVRVARHPRHLSSGPVPRDQDVGSEGTPGVWAHSGAQSQSAGRPLIPGWSPGHFPEAPPTAPPPPLGSNPWRSAGSQGFGFWRLSSGTEAGPRPRIPTQGCLPPPRANPGFPFLEKRDRRATWPLGAGQQRLPREPAGPQAALCPVSLQPRCQRGARPPRHVGSASPRTSALQRRRNFVKPLGLFV